MKIKEMLKDIQTRFSWIKKTDRKVMTQPKGENMLKDHLKDFTNNPECLKKGCDWENIEDTKGRAGKICKRCKMAFIY